MNLQIIVVFLLPVLTGTLLVHLLWPGRDVISLVLKAFLGVGIGLGLSSLLYFCYLFLFAGQDWFIEVELALFLALLIIGILRARRGTDFRQTPIEMPRLTAVQRVAVITGCVVFVISLLTTVSYLLRRRQGDWDAWMMYNRAARFVYLDQTHWLESFSPQMDPLFHADYPLLLAMNIASGWQAVGGDNPRVPMVQSGLFAVACVGLIAAGLAAVKSVGQAALGLVILWGIPEFVNEGARQMADVPLAFFISATGILFYLYAIHRKPGLLVLAGLTTGLAAWTKNEGSVLIVGAFIGVLVAFVRRHSWRPLLEYAIGLAAPLAIVIYFKVHLAPPGDILSSGESGSLSLITNPTRHLDILQYFSQALLSFGGWGIAPLAVGIIPILLVYYLLFRTPIAAEHRPAYLALGSIVMVQMLGYYGAYLITPYDLIWHLSYSTSRLVLQIFPLVLFLALCGSTAVESVFGSKATPTRGVNHASGN